MEALSRREAADIAWGFDLVGSERLRKPFRLILAARDHPLRSQVLAYLVEERALAARSPVPPAEEVKTASLARLLSLEASADRGIGNDPVVTASLPSGMSDESHRGLVELLSAPSEDVRAAAAREIGRYRRPGDMRRLKPLLLSGPIGVRLAALEALSWRGNKGASALVSRLLDEESLRFAAARALGEIGGSESIGHLRRVLRLRDRALRAEAMAAVGRVGGPAAHRLLIDQLDDPDAYVRVQAVMELAEAGDRSRFDQLAEIAGHTDPAVRMATLRALGLYGGRRACAVLVAGLDDDDKSVRMTAADALAGVDSPEAERYLRRALRHLRGAGEAEMRIAGALLGLGDGEAAAAVDRALSSKDRDTRLVAAHALVNVRNASDLGLVATALADGDLRVRLAAAKALVQIAGGPNVLVK